jgi:hypothetical protein
VVVPRLRTAIKLCTTTRHPECNEGSPKVALRQFQEILHCVQDDVAVPRLRTAIKLCTTTRHPECNEGSPKVALRQFQEILHCVQDDVAVALSPAGGRRELGEQG